MGRYDLRVEERDCYIIELFIRCMDFYHPINSNDLCFYSKIIFIHSHLLPQINLYYILFSTIDLARSLHVVARYC